jgi:ssDNA-binding Zn-finger/Zn-ribbon topoisomerase 1
MAEKAKTADRARNIQASEEIPCPKCGKPTRVVKRVKNREMGIAGGMYNSCTACDFAAKR